MKPKVHDVKNTNGSNSIDAPPIPGTSPPPTPPLVPARPRRAHLDIAAPAAAPPTFCDDRRRTTWCVNAAAVVERVDEQLLPALYRYVGASFGAKPSQLGALTLARALAQAVASPAAGLLGQYADRVAVLCGGATLWGAMTLGFAFSRSVAGGLAFWALNGVGLACLIPCAQSLTADYASGGARGAAFGALHMVGALGALCGALFATNVGHLRPLGVEGWHVAFVGVAVASWAVAGATWAAAVDPRSSGDPRYRVESASQAEAGAKTWKTVCSVPTFGIIVLQGCVGSAPWSALVFLTLYFQLLGFSDLAASLLMAAFLAANAAGGLLGGLLGDAAARRFPDHGRIAVCQLFVGVGVPLAALLFKGLPLSASAGAAVGYTAVLVATGLTITWAAPACNNPIFAEIVPPHMRNLIYAFDRSFEGAVAAAGAPLVGLLAERAFGYSGGAAVGDNPAENLAKARSLGSALLIFSAVPWTLCAAFFSGLHWTYPRDRERAAALAQEMHAAAEREAEERQRLTAPGGASDAAAV